MRDVEARDDLIDSKNNSAGADNVNESIGSIGIIVQWTGVAGLDGVLAGAAGVGLAEVAGGITVMNNGSGTDRDEANDIIVAALAK